MLLRRVIPCLDVDKGRVVKGVEFVDIRDAGDPVELAARYQDEGADEIVFLDITASHENRDTVAALARRCADELIETLSAPASSTACASSTERIPPPIVNGMKTLSAVRRARCTIVSRCSWDAVMSRNTSSSAPSAS